MAVFQPGGLDREGPGDDRRRPVEALPTPEVVLGQHVMVGPAGTVAGAPDHYLRGRQPAIRLFGRGAHGSMPQASIDPVVMAASVVLRLQTIVSREIAAPMRR